MHKKKKKTGKKMSRLTREYNGQKIVQIDMGCVGAQKFNFLQKLPKLKGRLKFRKLARLARKLARQLGRLKVSLINFCFLYSVAYCKLLLQTYIFP